jgi:hypothetical protein
LNELSNTDVHITAGKDLIMRKDFKTLAGNKNSLKSVNMNDFGVL